MNENRFSYDSLLISKYEILKNNVTSLNRNMLSVITNRRIKVLIQIL